VGQRFLGNAGGATDNAFRRVIREQWRFDMENAISAKSGAPVRFHDGKIIYDWQGQALGRLRGLQVYCMGGHYVGELKNGVIRDKNLNRGGIPPHNETRSDGPENPGRRNHGSKRNRRDQRQ
jgi:4-fold beta-flower domain-containing protein